MHETNTELAPANHEDHRKLLFQVQEFITTEVNFVDKMTQLEAAIQNKLHNKLSIADQNLCHHCQQNCHSILVQKEGFISELKELLKEVNEALTRSSPRSVTDVDRNNATQNAEQAVEKLVALYQKRAYQAYCQAIIDSVTHFAKLSSLMRDDKLGICSLLINATQRIPRHRLFFETLDKKYPHPEVHRAYHLAEQNGRTLNKAVSLDAIDQALAGRGRHAKKETGMALILKLQLNSFSINEEAVQHYSSDFLQSTLIQAYPYKFGRRDGQFLSLGKDQTLIDKALNLPCVHLNPQQFDTQALDDLWLKTQKPIWRVLKSIKPMDDSFGLISKLQAYQEVIECIQQGLLGKKDKVNLIWGEADNMLRVIQNQPTQAVSAELLSILMKLNRQLENLSSLSLFEKFQKFVPLFNTETGLSDKHKQTLSELHHMIAEQEEKRPLASVLTIRNKPKNPFDPLDEQTIFKVSKKPQYKKVYVAPESKPDRKQSTDSLKIEDIEIDNETDDDHSSRHE